MMNYKNLVKRMNEVCGYKGNKELAELLEISPQNLSNKTKAGTVLSGIIIEALKLHSEVNMHWLLTGEGEKHIQTDTSKPSKKPKCIYSRASDKENRKDDMLAHFSDKKMARECIEKLVEIDRMGWDGFERINLMINSFLEGLKSNKKKAGT